MSDQLKIEHPDPSSLSVKKTKIGGLFDLFASLGFLMVWDSVVLSGFIWTATGQLPTDLLTRHGWFTVMRTLTDAGTLGWMFLIALLFPLLQLFRSLKTGLFGEAFLFDGLARIISKNGKQRVHFSDCRGVEIRTIGGEGPAEYWVSVLLHSGGSLFVANSTSHEQMAKLAGDIARVLNTEVFTAKR